MKKIGKCKLYKINKLECVRMQPEMYRDGNNES